MDALGVTYKVMGGPSHCCGIVQARTGDTEVSGRVATNSLDKLAEGKTGVISWCASCHVQFTETTLPTIEKVRGSRPFEMTPFMLFLATRFDDLRPMLRKPVPLKVALHKHPGIKGVVEAGIELLQMVPGIEIVDLHQPAVGLMSNFLNALPDYKRGLHLAELEAAEAAGVDALVAIYHPDHRDLCAHERDWPFKIVNILDIVGESMGLHHDDHFKRLKIMQDADAIVADCKDHDRRQRRRSGDGPRHGGQGHARRSAAAARAWPQKVETGFWKRPCPNLMRGRLLDAERRRALYRAPMTTFFAANALRRRRIATARARFRV